MIDGLGDLIKATNSEDNTLLEKDERSDIEKLLDELKVIEEIVTYENSPSADPLRGMTVSTSPTVNDIIGYKGNLNAVIPAGFIMLHNDLGSLSTLTGNQEESINTKASDGSFLDKVKDLVSGFSGASFLTGLTNLATIAGFGVGVVGVIDNIKDAFNEDGSFNWGTFVGENALPLVCGTIAGIITGNPAIGAAVYGFMSTQDWWVKAEAETMEGYNTIQDILAKPGTAEYNALQSYITLHEAEAEWLTNQKEDEHVIFAGTEHTEAAATTELLVWLKDYLANGSESIYAKYFEPEKVINEETGTNLLEIFKQVADVYISETGDKFLEEGFKKDVLGAQGVRIETENQLLSWIETLSSAMGENISLEDFLSQFQSLYKTNKIDNQQLLFLYNVSRYMQNPEEFEYLFFSDLEKPKVETPVVETASEISIQDIIQQQIIGNAPVADLLNSSDTPIVTAINNLTVAVKENTAATETQSVTGAQTSSGAGAQNIFVTGTSSPQTNPGWGYFRDRVLSTD